MELFAPEAQHKEWWRLGMLKDERKFHIPPRNIFDVPDLKQLLVVGYAKHIEGRESIRQVAVKVRGIARRSTTERLGAMLRRVNAYGKSVLNSIIGLVASLGARVQNAFALPTLDSQTAPTTDPDFEEWLRNDVKVVVDPSHRYGENLSGFHADSESESPQANRPED